MCVGQRFAAAAEATPSGSPCVGMRLFWKVLQAHGVSDPVLAKRLFTEVSDGFTVNFRMFLFSLLVRQPDLLPSEKITLLFHLYDVDGSGTFSLSEVLQIVECARSLGGPSDDGGPKSSHRWHDAATHAAWHGPRPAPWGPWRGRHVYSATAHSAQRTAHSAQRTAHSA